MKTNPAVEAKKILNGPRVPGISPVGKERKRPWRKGFAEEPRLKFRMKD